MKTGRLEAFTDGVVAIIITITVLELPVPKGFTLAALRGDGPILAAYALSFVNVGLYWANHHHLLHATEKVDGRVLWANLFMLFWLSLVPWVIRWLDEAHFAALPSAAYGVVLGFAGIGYSLTQTAIIALNGPDSAVARAVGSDWKGKASILLYAGAVPIAFVANWLAGLIYIGVSLLWIVPDRRIEQELHQEHQTDR
jgi:uncharacterized membrane protein